MADGSTQTQDLLYTTVEIEIESRVFDIDFIVLPDAEDNRTLLGIDFLEKAAIVLVIPQRCWFYAGNPGTV